jgi:Ala-tRNA(Pro) deacylase
MEVVAFLKKSKVKHKVTKHKAAFTAQEVAAEEHEPGKFVAKAVVVKADDKYVMCVLPACYNIDLKKLKSQLKAKTMKIAEEKELGKIFSDCEIGAQPPFGNLYDLPTIMDKVLESDDHIMFQGGTHEKSVRMSMADYRKLVGPKVLEFSRHVAS